MRLSSRTIDWRSSGAETSSLHLLGAIGRCSSRQLLYSAPYASGGAVCRMCPAHHATTSPLPHSIERRARFWGEGSASAMARARLGFSAMKTRIGQTDPFAARHGRRPGQWERANKKGDELRHESWARGGGRRCEGHLDEELVGAPM